jgi:membrane-bound ClpP family serine protease
MEPGIDGTLGIRGSGVALPRLEGAGAQVDKLQAVSNYNLLCKALRPAGVGSIIFGLIAMAMGFAAMDENPINALLGIIGIFLLVEGIWILAVPSPVGMIVDGIALLIVGLWNISVTLGSAAGGISFFALLGVWQIVAGCKSFGRYSHFSKLPMSKPC